MSETRSTRYGQLFKTKRIICIAAFVCLAGSMMIHGADNKGSSKEVVERVLKNADKGKIAKIDCCYIEWGDLTMSISEKDLVEVRYDYKVTVKAAALDYLLKLKKAFEKFKYASATTGKTFDCRMSFGFYEQEKEVLRLTFVKNAPVILINGEPYESSYQVMDALLPILPHTAYEGFYSSVLDYWICTKN